MTSSSNPRPPGATWLVNAKPGEIGDSAAKSTSTSSAWYGASWWYETSPWKAMPEVPSWEFQLMP